MTRRPKPVRDREGKIMFIGLDQGTTSTRAILFDDDFSMVHEARREFRQIYPKEGWVEHNPEDIWQTVVEVLEECKRVDNLRGRRLDVIGITNKGETSCCLGCRNKRSSTQRHSLAVS